MSSFEEKYDYAMEMAAALTRDRNELRVKYDEALERARAAEAAAERLRLDLAAIDDLTRADRPHDWRLERIREVIAHPLLAVPAVDDQPQKEA